MKIISGKPLSLLGLPKVDITPNSRIQTMLKELLQASEASPEHRKLGGLIERIRNLLTSNGLLEILLSRINDRISLSLTTDQP